eukprot:PhF_6_TR42924/c0_g1_i6/m.65100
MNFVVIVATIAAVLFPTIALASIIRNQDSMGYSGYIGATPITGTPKFTMYTEWPTSFTKGTDAFMGSVYDADRNALWLIPFSATHVVKMDVDTGVMTTYNSWPSGFTKGTLSFVGGSFDGTTLWMAPYYATAVVGINAITGVMTKYDAWPSGVAIGGTGAFTGTTFDGTKLWLAPNQADRIVSVDVSSGAMVGYNTWPSGFSAPGAKFIGAIFDGTYVWMCPVASNQIVRVTPSDGSMVGYGTWPVSITFNGADLFLGAVYDGSNIYIIGSGILYLFRFNIASTTMTVAAVLPTSYYGGVFDGANIWLIPPTLPYIARYSISTGAIQRWTPPFDTQTSPMFFSGAFDGKTVWFIPRNADRLLRISSGVALQDGFGYSSYSIIDSYTPLRGPLTMRLHGEWPTGFSKGNDAFAGAIS